MIFNHISAHTSDNRYAQKIKPLQPILFVAIFIVPLIFGGCQSGPQTGNLQTRNLGQNYAQIAGWNWSQNLGQLGLQVQNSAQNSWEITAQTAGKNLGETAAQNIGQTSSQQQLTVGPVTLTFFGDVMLDRYVRVKMNKQGMDYPFAKMDLNYLSGPSLLIANLEGPIARKKAVTSKTIAFRFLPDVVPLLKKYSFDILSLANNHAIDMGAVGYNDTKDLLREGGIRFFGDPRGVNEDSVAKIEINGQKLAFFGLEEVVYKIKDDVAVAKIKELVAGGYKVVVLPHWGIEYQHKPNKRQVELAHKFIDAGALIIIGGHPHVVQSYENYNGHAIFYSLGNAIFDQYFSNDTQEGLSLKIVIGSGGAGTLSIELNPIRIDHSQMRLMTEDERAKFLQRFVTYGDHSQEEKAGILSGELKMNSL